MTLAGTVRGLVACLDPSLIMALTASADTGPSTTQSTPEPATWPRPALEAGKGASQRLLDIDSPGALVAVGEQGLILRSDNGSEWSQVPSPVDAMLTHVKFVDSARGFALGHDAVILETRDAGNRWSLRHHDAEARALLDLIQLEDQHWLAVGAYGGMLESNDDGANWIPVDNALTDLGMHLNGIVRTESGALFVAGERGLAARSTDNGQSWDVLDFPYAGSLFGARVLGQTLWVHGMRGRLYRTDMLEQCTTTPAETWDPYERVTLDDPDQVEARGWSQIATPTRESLFGAEAYASGLLLFGVNGTLLGVDVATGQARRIDVPADETLSAGVVHQGHLYAVGRRGITRVTLPE